MIKFINTFFYLSIIFGIYIEYTDNGVGFQFIIVGLIGVIFTGFMTNLFKMKYVMLYNKLFKKEFSKNLSDNKISLLSTSWSDAGSICKNCRSYTGHEEFMSNICNSCGEHRTQELHYTSYRKVFYNGTWKTQEKDRNGKNYLNNKLINL